MRTNAIAAALFALLVVLAGCTGGLAGDGGADDGAGPTGDASVDDGDQRDTDGGAVNFWISDQPNDIDDFEHLNVTVTKVAFHHVGGNATDREAGASDEGNATDGAEGEGEREDGAEDEAGESENGRWIERDVDNRSVDLTRLKGNNATLIGAFDLPEGQYSKVFVYVGGIDATLADGGESANVKLPSDRLHLNEKFEVTSDESPDFVFDIAVHEAGNSGKYILKPVVSESGTGVPIEDADRGRPDDPGNGNGNGPPDDAGNGNGNGNGPPDDAGNGNGNGNGNGPPDDAGNGNGNGNGNGPGGDRIAPADADRRIPIADPVR
ncbi:hypothetical protein BRD00_13770 [Halobacteriales archaeon QS_8_69_26]|nr:MAG: hypothetical protein BRD00_13770 [Halobacteriales archaeon QS_8_69_26]